MNKKMKKACPCAFDLPCPKAAEKQRHLMQQITECEFICIDINLFLDTHPEDERALADYNCYSEQLRTLKDLYTHTFGPIENFGNGVSLDSWKWAKTPFPWHCEYLKGKEGR